MSSPGPRPEPRPGLSQALLKKMKLHATTNAGRAKLIGSDCLGGEGNSPRKSLSVTSGLTDEEILISFLNE
jgi:hypothetical protein